MMTIWTGTDVRGEIVRNAVLLDFARNWGFRPSLCRPYRPQTKGKIESEVKYVRRAAGGGQNASRRALAETAIQSGEAAYFMTAHDPVTDLGRAYRGGRLDRRLRI
ncbi:MAG: hypothetical protein ABSG65_12810 [Bryobacteraceae bacterium]|jgi:transposase